MGARPELFESPAGFGDADHRHIEVATLQHRLQRGKDLLVGEIAGCTKEDQSIGMGIESCQLSF